MNVDIMELCLQVYTHTPISWSLRILIIWQYWDWGRTAENPLKSAVFDGSDTSMGGNGYFIPGRNDTTPGPPGQGGGCIETGPFKK